MKASRRRICLATDNFSIHIVQFTYSNIKIVLIRPGITYVLQPLGCGIIRSFKAKYKNIHVSHYLKEGEKGSRDKANIRDALEQVYLVWIGLSIDSIQNC